jgi:hypothetical protein
MAQSTQEVEKQVIEQAMRQATGTSSGKMRVQRKHVEAVRQKLSKAKPQAIKASAIWGWLSEEALAGRHLLRDTTTWSNAWMSTEEMQTRIDEAAIDRLEGAAKETAAARLNRRQCTNTVQIWLSENEEKCGGVQVLRSQKLVQLRAAKQGMMKPRGGTKALYATLSLLTHSGKLVLEEDPGSGGVRGKRTDWLATATVWVRTAEWPTEEKTEGFAQQAQEAQSSAGSSIVEVMHTILDMGEGWGGIRRAVEAMEEGVRSVGVDRRGFTALGKDLEQIISRICVDFAEPTKAQNLLRKIAAKGGRALHTYLMAWLSPECTLFSQANWMNVTRGCAHGAAALDPRNISASTPERQAEEADLVQEAKKALVAQLQALAEEPGMMFALEQPRHSALWDLPEVTSIIEGQPTWTKHEVDQCAYGRGEQKPSVVMTNYPWQPTGLTGTGKCIQGKCGGTSGNQPGDRRHTNRVVQASKRWNGGVADGTTSEQRGGLSVQAKKNEVEGDLVRELVRAAIAEQTRRQAAPLRGIRKRRRTEVANDCGTRPE